MPTPNLCPCACHYPQYGDAMLAIFLSITEQLETQQDIPLRAAVQCQRCSCVQSLSRKFMEDFATGRKTFHA